MKQILEKIKETPYEIPITKAAKKFQDAIFPCPPSVIFPMYNPDKFHDKKVYLHVYYRIIRGDTQTHKNSRKPLILLENLEVYGYIA